MKRLLVLLLALAAVVPNAGSALESSPVVYAHRGGRAHGPENTLGLFRQTWQSYGDDGVWLELDTQAAKDGTLVIIHDATLERTTSCSGRVIDRTAAELQACDASKGWPAWGFEPVPTLRSVLSEGRGAGWRLLLELKNIPTEPNFDASGTAAADLLLADLAVTGFPSDRIAVQSFFPTSLDRIELLAPEIDAALLTTSQLPGAPPGVGFTASENIAYATARGYEICAPDYEATDFAYGSDVVSAAHAAGRTVVVWTVNDPADIAAAVSWGVDGIISDYPDRVYAAA